ncbi:ubiquitin-conjugating enzyme E2 variant 3 isoform X3 [Vulpes lagopus]|uniref:ubiquitin-conjugating enzyme E2 variant 3 isoform X3 n=1 Tax=Vulpes lagopus TaxID=494514 RepID=UPI001BCA5A04|nr:ubiquitin-conjugating enzyme E2 variant 3 isoform X3 [Vulpes lagopus]
MLLVTPFPLSSSLNLLLEFRYLFLPASNYRFWSGSSADSGWIHTPSGTLPRHRELLLPPSLLLLGSFLFLSLQTSPSLLPASGVATPPPGAAAWPTPRRVHAGARGTPGGAEQPRTWALDAGGGAWAGQGAEQDGGVASRRSRGLGLGGLRPGVGAAAGARCGRGCLLPDVGGDGVRLRGSQAAPGQVFKDSSQKDLLNFTGTIPVMYQGNTYNIPIRLWILDSHPFAPPICFLKPTANMGISVGKHVDAKGRIYLPYLQNWSHPKSVIVGLIKEMIAKFQEELPLYSLSSSDEARQVDLLAYIAKITEGVSDINSKNWVNHEHKTVNKITVVGGGELGIACTLAISAKGIADRLVLLDLSEETKGGVMDLDIFSLPNVEISKGKYFFIILNMPFILETGVTFSLGNLPE